MHGRTKRTVILVAVAAAIIVVIAAALGPLHLVGQNAGAATPLAPVEVR
jgi:hypothetical protein